MANPVLSCCCSFIKYLIIYIILFVSFVFFLILSDIDKDTVFRLFMTIEIVIFLMIIISVIIIICNIIYEIICGIKNNICKKFYTKKIN